MPEDSEMVHIRLPKEMIKKIDHLAVDEDLYRQGVLERLLAIALDVVGEQGGRLPNSEAPA